MKSANQALLTLLQKSEFSEGKTEQCAELCRKWKASFQLNDAMVNSALTQFAAQLLHGVRSEAMTPAIASETLARLIALSDLDIPASVFALQEVLQSMADKHQTKADQQQVKQEMGRILQSMPHSELHDSDRCRYTGRYQDTRRTA